MKKIKINISELEDAFENCSMEHHYFLDTQKSGIIFISDFADLEEDKEKLYEKMDNEPDRYLSIPERDSREDYDEMAEFAGMVDDKILREKLAIALDGRGAFRRFKYLLDGYPQERQRWFEFKGERTKQRVKEWLEENGLEII